MSIRDIRPDERAAAQNLTFAAYEEYAAQLADWHWKELRETIARAFASQEPVQHLIAERDGEIVGSVLLFAADSDAYAGAVAQASVPEIRLLAVAPEARGTGVGKALVEACVQRARQAGANAIGLHTSDEMQAATQLYLQRGFVRDPAQDFVVGGGAVTVKSYLFKLTDAD